ncbi:MAG TPA: hypothetical protein VKF37_02555 [Chloroflexota bacterium]|nr:hypothetical protein [Chloroflexota bacterium]
MSDDPNADYVVANIPLIGPGTGYSGYTPVPSWAVNDAITVLQCHVARYSGVGVVPDEIGITRLMIATCRTLAALLEAHAARSDRYGAYEVIDQIDDLLGSPDTREHLEAMRGRRVDPDIVDALLALDQRVREKRPKGRPAPARSAEPQQPSEGENHGCGE